MCEICDVWPPSSPSQCHRWQVVRHWRDALHELVEAWHRSHRGDIVLDALDATHDLIAVHVLTGVDDQDVTEIGRELMRLERRRSECCGDEDCPDCRGRGRTTHEPLSRVQHYHVERGEAHADLLCPRCAGHVTEHDAECRDCLGRLVVDNGLGDEIAAMRERHRDALRLVEETASAVAVMTMAAVVAALMMMV